MSMASLYLLSIQPYAGKSAVALALALELRARGLKVGFMKPLGTVPEEVEGRYVDGDAYFMQRTLRLADPLETICPVVLTTDLREAVLSGEYPPVRERVAGMYAALAREQDLLILEGPGSLATGLSLDLAPAQVAALADARVVLVIKGDAGLVADDVLLAKEVLGERLSGVIVNAVARSLVGWIREDFGPFLERQGLHLFGVIPEDRLLTAMTVGELADLLNGHMLCCPEMRSELVQHFIVGAMGAQAAYHYFLRLTDKAVITGGDRTDIQMAALSTPSTKCLILTGNLYPEINVVTRAREHGVAVILVPSDTFQTVEMVEEAWGHIRLSSPQQVERLWDMVRRECDFDALTRAIGLGPP